MILDPKKSKLICFCGTKIYQMSQIESKIKTTKNDTKMTTKLIYDVKGCVDGVDKNYWGMSDTEIASFMEGERFSLTCAPGGENNRGMEIIGRMPIKGEGFTADDIEDLGPYFRKLMVPDLKTGVNPVAVFDLNALSLDLTVDDLPDEDQARVLLLRDWAASSVGAHGWTNKVYRELASRRWDAEYLDPNKYRTEIVDGKEVRVRGRPMNKRARTNLCFVAGREQEPAVLEGKGSIYDLKKMGALVTGVEKLKEQISAGLIEIGSKTKVEINVVEGNRYYNLKNTGIGFHGDTERVVVICISIGCDNYPMRWQWFKDGMPVGKSIDITLNCGDVYIMSEKAVGSDWKKKSLYTLRHSAGAKKYRDLSKWEKKRPAYEARVAVRDAAKAKKFYDKKAKAGARLALKAEKVKANDKKNKGKTTKNGSLKTETKPTAWTLLCTYKNALKKHDWEDNDAGFYRWVAIEAEHACSPDNAFFKEFMAIWSDPAKMTQAMDMKMWEEKRHFYGNLCAYGVFW